MNSNLTATKGGLADFADSVESSRSQKTQSNQQKQLDCLTWDEMRYKIQALQRCWNCWKNSEGSWKTRIGELLSPLSHAQQSAYSLVNMCTYISSMVGRRVPVIVCTAPRLDARTVYRQASLMRSLGDPDIGGTAWGCKGAGQREREREKGRVGDMGYSI